MKGRRLILKHPNGWFAAGREYALALELLSDDTFKLYAYLCLNADRHTGRISIALETLARQLRKAEATIVDNLRELSRIEVCEVRHDHIEITDRFWPYEKQRSQNPSHDVAECIPKVSRFEPTDRLSDPDPHPQAQDAESHEHRLELAVEQKLSREYLDEFQKEIGRKPNDRQALLFHLARSGVLCACVGSRLKADPACRSCRGKGVLAQRSGEVASVRQIRQYVDNRRVGGYPITGYGFFVRVARDCQLSAAEWNAAAPAPMTQSIGKRLSKNQRALLLLYQEQNK